MKALNIITATTALYSEEVNQHRTDLLRQQLRSRGLEFSECGVEERPAFALVVDLDGVDHSEVIRLARRYGQEYIVVWREDGKAFKYNLAPGSGGPSVTSIEELP